MVYPAFFGGYIYNDNAYATSTNRVGESGLRLNPSFQASLDNGLHKTTVSFNADAQIYPALGQQTRYVVAVPESIQDAAPSNVTGGFSLTHIWSPEQDFTITGLGSYARQSGLLGASLGQIGATTGGLSQPYLASIGTFSGTEQYSNQYSGMISLQDKLTSAAFVTATLGVQYISYDSTPTTTTYAVGALPTVSAPGGNGQSGGGLTFSVRGGYWLTPQVYGYVEPGLDLRRYLIGANDTNGYRVVAGLGSDMVSLFKGEIWGGVQAQASAEGYFGATVAPTYGARVSYYPTRDLTVGLSVSSNLGEVTATRIGSTTPLGVAAAFQPSAISQTQQALLQADYVVNSYITASLRGGLGKTETTTPESGSIVWSGGATINYTFWRNIALTLNYQFTKTATSQTLTALDYLTNPGNLTNPQAPSGYVQNLVSAGMTYHY